MAKKRTAPPKRPNATPSHSHTVVQKLNAAQDKAVKHGNSPLLIIAGAGTGKTMTLAHRVARLIDDGTPPERILLLTFTRRSAEDLLHRVETIRRQKHAEKSDEETDDSVRRVWGGTFHSVGSRLLRYYGSAIGIAPRFTIHDRDDSEELLDTLRTELKFGEKGSDFPKKGSLMTVHSGWINSAMTLNDFLSRSFPWFLSYKQDFQRLFEAYSERKQQQNTFDYDDLLVNWNKLLADPGAGEIIRRKFDCVLVDEYQDTNPIQAEILQKLRPNGAGLTAVGDDAQSIYSFRGATIRNILDFPEQFPGTTIIALEENYRSTMPILEATNLVIAEASEGYSKELYSNRKGGDRPVLAACSDEYAEARYIVDQIANHRKAGLALSQQAVLFRSAHHSLSVELELTKRKIPFHKYGGLKFADSAHVKDLVAFLRLAENPRDIVAGLRVLKLLPGIGTKKAHAILVGINTAENHFDYLAGIKPTATTALIWPSFISLMKALSKTPPKPVPEQILQVIVFYTPLLTAAYDNAEQRLDDLRKLVELAGRHEDRTSFLSDLTLDPPASTLDLAGKAARPTDYLTLSTIHSAKGLEWDVVFVINAVEGAIPSTRALDESQLDEERRLFYVALTRAKTWLTVTYPRYRSSFHSGWGNWEPPTLTQFLPKSIRRLFSETKA